MNQVSKYHKTNSSKISFKECWYLTRNWQVVILCVMKLLRIKLPDPVGIPRSDTLREWQVKEEKIPEICHEPIVTNVSKLGDLGFHSPFYHVIKGLLMPPAQEQQDAGVAMLHRSGETVAIVIHVKHTNGLVSISKTVVSLVSLRTDGTFLETNNAAQQIIDMPGDSVKRLVGATPEELWRAHQERLSGGREPELIQKVKSEAELIKLLDYNDKRSFEFHIKRGYYTMMSDREVELMREQMTSRSHSAISSMPAEASIEEHEVLSEVDETLVPNQSSVSRETPALYQEVLDEIQRKESEKPGWGNAVLILGVSALLFMAAGPLRWTWQTTLLLLGVLLIHELGHFVAMKLFKYRNVRMFFIPFFGAAVSGKHYNVPGWKKVIVSLMGPLPGIIFGAILGSLGMLLGQSYLTDIAIMFLILNGFNLLPFLPLDGGWVLHSTFFCRHYLLDITFRSLAGVGFVAWGYLGGGTVLLILGVFMLLGLPLAYKKAKAVHTLKLKGVTASALEGDTMPPETAREIVAEINASYNHAALNTKIIAQHTVQIFESLNAQPPGWLGSGAALVAQVGGFAMAVLFCVVFIFGPNPGMLSDLADVGRFAMFGEDEPTLLFDCNEDTSWVGVDADASTELLDNVIVATVESPEIFEELFQKLSSQLPDGTACRKFGQTVFLAIPAPASEFRGEWFARFEEHSKNVFAHSSNYPVTASLVFNSPSEELAVKMNEEIEAFFATSMRGNLIPPWEPHDDRDPGLKAEHAKARATYGLILNAVEEAFDPDAGNGLNKQMQVAIRRGDKEELKRLQVEADEVRRTRERKAVELLRLRKDLDQEVLDLWGEAEKEVAEGSYEGANKKLFERMGALPAVDGETQLGSDRYSVQWGMVAREGDEIHLSQLRFVSPAYGLPAMAEWLCSKGCKNIRYSFNTFDYGD
ncbi:MAG: site-2 protease family protein [Verrucomicrobiales bacterium]|nr:site-2 protease family protein [Verrucomicrobiales bacterium]